MGVVQLLWKKLTPRGAGTLLQFPPSMRILGGQDLLPSEG